MAEVSFPSEWRIWTQPQREAMFRDYVMGTCRERGYSGRWHAEITGREAAILSDHVNAFMVKNRSRMDTYDRTKSIARLAAFHICPERSGGAPSGSQSGRGSGPMSFARSMAVSLLPWLGPPPQVSAAPDTAAAWFAFGGVIVGPGEDHSDAAPVEGSEPSDASPFDPFAFFAPLAEGAPIFAGPALLYSPAIP